METLSCSKEMDLTISRVRVLLSMVVLASIYVDPNTGGWFNIDRRQLIVLLAHLAYGLGTLVAVERGWAVTRVLQSATVLDVLFAMIVAFVTEGTTSPSYVFFVFAVIAAGFRSSLPFALAVTLASVSTYVLVIAIVLHGVGGSYMMRAGYLAITGCLIGYFGSRRTGNELASEELILERPSMVARDVGEDYVQMLAGVNLWLQTCQGMLRKGQAEETLAQLTDMQTSITREYDEMRRAISPGDNRLGAHDVP